MGTGFNAEEQQEIAANVASDSMVSQEAEATGNSGQVQGKGIGGGITSKINIMG